MCKYSDFNKMFYYYMKCSILTWMAGGYIMAVIAVFGEYY